MVERATDLRRRNSADRRAVRRQQHSQPAAIDSANRGAWVEVDRWCGQRLWGSQHRARARAGPTGRAGRAPERSRRPVSRGRRRWTARSRRGAQVGGGRGRERSPQRRGRADADGDRKEGAQSGPGNHPAVQWRAELHRRQNPRPRRRVPGPWQSEVRSQGGSGLRRREEGRGRGEETSRGGRPKTATRRPPDASRMSSGRSSRTRSCPPSRPPTSTRCSDSSTI